MCMLVDFYGELLTEKQRKVFSLYWENDYSLFEISEQLKITRQAVHDCLHKTQQILIDMENKCGFVQKYQENKRDLELIVGWLDLSDCLQAEIAKKLSDIIDRL